VCQSWASFSWCGEAISFRSNTRFHTCFENDAVGPSEEDGEDVEDAKDDDASAADKAVVPEDDATGTAAAAGRRCFTEMAAQ
jgi:hypothetical protein